MYSVRAVNTAKIDRLPPRFSVTLYSTENKLIFALINLRLLAPVPSHDRILTVCNRAASVGEDCPCHEGTLHVRVPTATPSRGGSFILRNPKKERTNTIIFQLGFKLYMIIKLIWHSVCDSFSKVAQCVILLNSIILHTC